MVLNFRSARNINVMNETTQKEVRKDFEPCWTRWNPVRATFAMPC